MCRVSISTCRVFFIYSFGWKQQKLLVKITAWIARGYGHDNNWGIIIIITLALIFYNFCDSQRAFSARFVTLCFHSLTPVCFVFISRRSAFPIVLQVLEALRGFNVSVSQSGVMQCFMNKQLFGSELWNKTQSRIHMDLYLNKIFSIFNWG